MTVNDRVITGFLSPTSTGSLRNVWVYIPAFVQHICFKVADAKIKQAQSNIEQVCFNDEETSFQQARIDAAKATKVNKIGREMSKLEQSLYDSVKVKGGRLPYGQGYDSSDSFMDDGEEDSD